MLCEEYPVDHYVEDDDCGNHGYGDLYAGTPVVVVLTHVY